MDSLNPRWLTIELDSIDHDVEKWNDALRRSYEASFRALTQAGKDHPFTQNSESIPNSCDS
jgi:hypothetical protein